MVKTWIARLLAVGAALLLCAGCSGDTRGHDDFDDLVAQEDSSSGSAQAEENEPAARKRTGKLTTDQQDIIEAYQGYFTKCYPEASAKPAQSLDILSECATGPQLETATAGIADAVLREDTFNTKHMKFRPMPPSIVGEEAVVHDCLDSRDVGRVHKTTGEVLTRGVAEDSTVITLRQEDEVWKVFAIESHTDPGRFC